MANNEGGRGSGEAVAAEACQGCTSADQTTADRDAEHTKADPPAGSYEMRDELLPLHMVLTASDSKAQTCSSLDKDRTQHSGHGQLGLDSGWEVVADGGVGDGDGEPSSSSTHTHSEPYTASLDIKVGWGKWKYTVYSRQWDCLVHFTHESPQEANEQSRGRVPSVEERRG